MTDRRPKLVCTGCGLELRFLPWPGDPLPKGWTGNGDGLRCAACADRGDRLAGVRG